MANPKINPNFRKTTAATQLARILFDPAKQLNISPAQISKLLVAAGVPVPKGVQVGADIAQIILAGGAIINDVRAGLDIGSIMAPSAQMIGAAVDMFGLMGWADPSSPGMQILRLGADTGAVIQSEGLNVLADVSLALDFVQGVIFPKDERPLVHAQLKQKAYKDAEKWFNARENTQLKTAATLFQSYQNKSISIFEMLGGIADKSPDLFLNYFPDFKTFVPPVTISKTFTETGQAKHGGVFGLVRASDTISESYSISFESVVVDAHRLVSIFVEKYISIPFAPYRFLASYSPSMVAQYGYPKNAASKFGITDHTTPVYPRISLIDMAVLSMFPPYFDFLHDDFDIKPFLLSMNLTPSELGYPELMNDLMSNYYSHYDVVKEPAFTINGVDYFQPRDIAQNKIANENNYEVNKSVEMDYEGNIVGLLNIPAANKLVTEFGIMPYVPGQMESQMPGSYANLPANSSMGYRNIRNYWGAIAILDMMKKDPYFLRACAASTGIFADVEKWVPAVELIDSKHREIQFKSVGKKLNAQAKYNVAKYLGTTADKLTFRPLEVGKLAAVI